MTNRIEKTIDIDAPLDRVWDALTDVWKFNVWFKVDLQSPFVIGEVSRGPITFPGAEHLIMEVKIVAIEPNTRFAYLWHPYAVKPDIDYTLEESTLVEFHLEPRGQGVRVTVTETGFDTLPEHRRAEALAMNTRGWTTQVENLKAYAER